MMSIVIETVNANTIPEINRFVIAISSNYDSEYNYSKI